MLASALQAASSHLDVSEAAEALGILRPEVTSCRVSRPILPELESLLREIICDADFAASAALERRSLERDVRRLVHRVPSRALAAWLVGDIAELAELFLRLTAAERCEARLEVVTQDGCRRFHHDFVPMRILCTYVGPGTEIAARESVDARALVELRTDFEEANREAILNPSAVVHTKPMDIVLLKGAEWPEHRGLGAVHRSPPIFGAGVRRLVLRIDGANHRTSGASEVRP